MRVAICFYGFLRHWRRTVNRWMDLRRYYNADLFIYTWDTEQYKDRELGDFPFGKTAEDLDINGVINSFQPTEIATETYKLRYPEIMEKSNWIFKQRDKFIEEHPEHSNLIENRVPSNYSMWYTWGKVAELKRKHEEDSRYDVVLLTRTDFNPASFDFSNRDKIVTPPWPDSGIQPWVNYEEGISDLWIYGPSFSMDVLCNLYNSTDLIWRFLMQNYDFERIINPHKMPALYMKMAGLEYIKNASQNGSKV